jgi:hypothetical protein
MSKSEFTYDMSGFQHCWDQDKQPIVSITLRTTDGRDEQYAARQAEARKSAMSEELIRVSLVRYRRAVSTEPGSAIETVELTQPYIGFDSWSTRARNFAVAAWQRLSTPSADDLESFFASATAEPRVS